MWLQSMASVLFVLPLVSSVPLTAAVCAVPLRLISSMELVSPLAPASQSQSMVFVHVRWACCKMELVSVRVLQGASIRTESASSVILTVCSVR